MEFLKKLTRPVRLSYYQNRNEKRFRKAIRLSDDYKIVVGSSGIHEENWIPSERYFLDLLKVEDWEKYFEKGSINNILAEHVWEHLTFEQGVKAAEVCYKFLKKSGVLRIAVPDGFHFDNDYIEYVKIGGSGLGAHDHKVLYDYKILGDLLAKAGFSIELIEYFDEGHKFHAKEWSNENGFVNRSLRFDKRNSDGKPNYTSLIIDAKK